MFAKTANAIIRGNIFALIFLLLPLSCSMAQAKSFSYGFTVGVPLNDLATADSSHVANTSRLTFGPGLRIFLQRSLGLDADLLYKKLHTGFASNPARITFHRLELVPMLRYSFPTSSIRPFIHVGMSFNWIMAVCGSDICTDTTVHDKYYCIEDKTVAELRHSHTHGFVLGTGADLQLKALNLTPELRVTRWVDRNFGTLDSPLRSNLTQVELLLKVSF